MSLGRVLIFGSTGQLGSVFVKESLKAGHPTFLFVRSDFVSDVKKVKQLVSFKQLGASFLMGSLDDHRSIVNALKQVDFVVSTVGEDQLLEQLKIVDAAKEAGNIKRFLPSEYGLDPDHVVDCPPPANALFQMKVKVRRALEESGIPYTFLSANCLSGFFLSGLAQFGRFYPPSDEVSIYGDGNTKVVWNAEEDVAIYAMKVLQDPRTINKTIYVRPTKNMLSLNEVVEIWEQLSGKELKKYHIDEATWFAKIEGFSTNLKISAIIFHLVFYLGKCCDFVIKDDCEASKLYPEVSSKSVKQFLSEYIV